MMWFTYDKNDIGLFGGILREASRFGEFDGVTQMVSVRRQLVSTELVWQRPVEWTRIIIFIFAGGSVKRITRGKESFVK